MFALRTFAATSRRVIGPSSARLGLRFQSSTSVSAPPAPVVKKKVTSVKSSVVGFITGAVVSGFGAWVYLAEEYKVQNEILARDVDALREAVDRVEVLMRQIQSDREEEKRLARKR